MMLHDFNNGYLAFREIDADRPLVNVKYTMDDDLGVCELIDIVYKTARLQRQAPKIMKLIA